MSKLPDAYDADRPLMLRCACGQDHAPGDHGAAPASAEEQSLSFMEASLVKALFPVDSVRRGFLRAVGAKVIALGGTFLATLVILDFANPEPPAE